MYKIRKKHLLPCPPLINKGDDLLSEINSYKVNPEKHTTYAFSDIIYLITYIECKKKNTKKATWAEYVGL